MTDDEWDGWEEWLAQDRTRRFFQRLRAQADLLEEDYKQALFDQPSDPNSGQFPHQRARSLVFRELSQIDRTMMEGLMDEHDWD